jgi:ABC-type amino acid transport substrate-binding protein
MAEFIITTIPASPFVMLCRSTLLLLALAICSSSAVAKCDPIQFGYLDQDRPPYWLGRGTEVPEPPGASVELVRRFAASVGCSATLKRLPVLRIRSSLQAGEIDFAPMDASSDKLPGVVFPRDRANRLDTERGVSSMVVVFVRATDNPPRDMNPARYLQGKLIGVTLGSPYIPRLTQAGLTLDSGATDVARNLDKLRLRRIDAFAVSVVSATDMDAYVAARYGKQLVRLQRPLFSDHIWLAASQSYYDSHRIQVEAMWNWLGTSGRKEFSALLDKYTDKPSAPAP